MEAGTNRHIFRKVYIQNIKLQIRFQTRNRFRISNNFKQWIPQIITTLTGCVLLSHYLSLQFLSSLCARKHVHYAKDNKIQLRVIQYKLQFTVFVYASFCIRQECKYLSLFRLDIMVNILSDLGSCLEV